MAVLQRTATVRANRRATDRLWFLELEVDDIGAALAPGQFIHVRIPRMADHILRRPFSVFRTDEHEQVLVILYQTVGFGSRHMTTLVPGEKLDVMGPIGHGWQTPEDASRALLVAGGVGAAPLYLYAKELVEQSVDVTVVLGAQTADALVCEPSYTVLLGGVPYLATDDGSRGHAGFVTDVVTDLLSRESFDYAACCGPEPMMHLVSKATLEADIPTAVSLEKRMACGIGACLSCIVETTEGRRRSCVDGPIFDAKKVIW